MPLNIEEKKNIVIEVALQVAKASTVVIAEYRGITVDNMTQLRAKARAQGVYMRVLKNTLARRAVADTPLSGLAQHMIGPLIYGMSEDAVAAAKVLNDFAKTNDKLVLKAGFYGGKMMDAGEVKALASIPSRLELLSMLVGVMQAPVSGMARVLAAIAAKKQLELAAG
ncbi:MAG: 50S ribosomal protein L10 [Ottowia sp.]|nr:50S ribosomal protein L10 [Ottowia sp.]